VADAVAQRRAMVEHMNPALPISQQCRLLALPRSSVYRKPDLSGGWVADRIGRRWAIIIPALLAIPIARAYLLTSDYAMIVVFFALQGLA